DDPGTAQTPDDGGDRLPYARDKIDAGASRRSLRGDGLGQLVGRRTVQVRLGAGIVPVLGHHRQSDQRGSVDFLHLNPWMGRR
ncbi:MAG: hypothetical protein QOI16_3429, partial [Pseudonocardiales bacterium]|nr:hypothetical protein [Pseudonocardiales bacterium]